MVHDMDSSHPSRLPKALTKHLPHSKSAAKQAFHEKIKDETQQLWLSSPRYKTMKATDPTTAPSNSYIRLTTPLSKKVASTITQIKARDIPLAKYLHQIGKEQSPTCPYCQQGDETYDTTCYNAQNFIRRGKTYAIERGVETYSRPTPPLFIISLQ